MIVRDNDLLTELFNYFTFYNYCILVPNHHQISFFQEELSKAVPEEKNLMILNRNIFNGNFHKCIPTRLAASPRLIMDEFYRFYPQYKNIERKVHLFFQKLSINSDTMEGIEQIQKQISAPKSASNFISRVPVSQS